MTQTITNMVAALVLLTSLASAQIAITSGSPFFEDFEGNVTASAGETCPAVGPTALANGFVNLAGDGNEWTPDNNGTPSVGTGPFIDQNPGNAVGIYLYVEASGSCTNAVAELASPQFDISGLTSTQAAFDFWYHLDGLHSGSISVDTVEQVNSGSDGAVAGGSDTFNSVGAAFTANHVGTQITISGSTASDGVYDIIAFIDADNVQLGATFASAESSLNFIHTNTTTGVAGPFSGDQGGAWQNSGDTLLNTVRLNFGADGNEQLFTVIIRGTTGAGFQSDMAIDSFTMRGDAPAVDLSPIAISAPALPVADGCIPLSASELVTVEVSNNQAPIPAGTQIPLTLDVNSGAQIIGETFTLVSGVAQGASVFLQFAMPADLSTLGANTLSVSYTGMDSVPGNDVLNVAFDNPNAAPAVLPVMENFDGSASNNTQIPPAGWIQDQNDGTSDWFFRNTGPTSGNGPFEDHTTGVAGVGYFAHVEDSTGEGANAQVNLISPCVDLTTATNPVVDFWVNSMDTTTAQNELGIDIITSGGIVLDVVPPIGDTGGVWTNFSTSLTPFIGDVIRVRFRGRNDNPNNGSNDFTDDTGIDDVLIADIVPGLGQAPQPGLAELDINGAAEANGFPLNSGFNGPYFSSITAPTAMTIDMRGEANQPILLLLGTLTINAVAFPGIGQLDIADPNFAVIGDGTQGGLINSFFILDPNGERQFVLPTNNLPGFFSTFQAVMFNTTPSVLSFSNAVEVTVM